MTTGFDVIRQALKRARQVARAHHHGGLQDLWQLTKDALVALDLLEEQGKTRQLSLWQEEGTTQQLGGNNG